jgi:hypothetical protein
LKTLVDGLPMKNGPFIDGLPMKNGDFRKSLINGGL